jgi:hypothetical protein
MGTRETPVIRLAWVMPSARVLAVLAVAACIAAGAVLAVGCDESGTIVGVDAAADASGDVGTETYDGPGVFDATGTETGAPDAGDAAATTDAAAFAFIEFSEVPVGGGTFTAAFYATPAQPQPGCMTVVPDGGACAVTTCAGHTPSDAGLVTLASAGALDVTGGAFGDAGVQVGPDTLGTYLYNTTGPMFAPGDTLSVSAAGGVVPAFAPQPIAAPAAITVTAPLPGDAGVLIIPTSQSLAVTWTGGVTNDRVVFTLNALFSSGASASTACSWNAVAGQGTIPAGVLAPLVAGTAQSGGSTAVWYQLAQTSFAAGRWAVTMQAAIHGGSLATFQ